MEKIKLFLNVRPRIYANGAISTIPSLIITSISFALKYSLNTSNIGLVQGAIFCSKVPGKNPISSSTDTAGLLTISLSSLPSLISLTATCTAKRVLPVPAGTLVYSTQITRVKPV